MKEIINKSKRERDGRVYEQVLGNIVDCIMEFNLCGDGEGVDKHNIVFDLENCGAAPYLLIDPQEFNALWVA